MFQTETYDRRMSVGSRQDLEENTLDIWRPTDSDRITQIGTDMSRGRSTVERRSLELSNLISTALSVS